jgi:hypothetical protein
MSKRLAAFIEFVRTFVNYAMYVREAIVSLLLLIVLGGCAIAKVEGVKLGDAVYFAFITGLSIGYGDIAPKTGLGRVVSVAIGLVGMLFVGLTVAVATRALRDTVEHSRKTN